MSEPARIPRRYYPAIVLFTGSAAFGAVYAIQQGQWPAVLSGGLLFDFNIAGIVYLTARHRRN